MRTITKLIPALALVAACSVSDSLDEFPSMEDWVDGKEDTGYVGNRAAEIEASFTGHVEVAQPGKSAEELETIAAALRENPRSWSHRDITGQVTEQIKYARNVLKAQKYDLNLEGGAPTFSAITVGPESLTLAYSVEVESLVKFKDLEERGLTPADLVGNVIDVTLPVLPAGLFERTGNKCATDGDTGDQPAAEDLGAHNLFYYFDPARDSCPMAEADLVVAKYQVNSSLDAPTVYPEYDQLVADGKITMVAIFGQITHGELGSNDWGFISFNTFTRKLRYLGFDKTETFADNRGQQLSRTYPGGLEIVIDVYTPVDFADHVPREQSNEVFRAAMRSHEIVYYNGHAFYGSLKVLDEPSAYPEDTYQIIFMDACWSYAYYTKQVFRNKATEADPDGYALTDVVNNTEPGITGSEETAVILYQNIFKGAAAVHSGGNPSLYSWNNMTAYMNAHAEERAARRTSHPDPEIYGASGVRTNSFQPGGNDPDPDPTGDRFENNTPVEIPDNDAVGVTSTINIPAGVAAADTVVVEVEIEHSYVGDLTVTLEHNGVSSVLHDRSGGSANDLSLNVAAADFAGSATSGAWALTITDSAEIDSGRLNRWAIVIAD